MLKGKINLLLQLQECSFAVEAAGVASEGAVGAYNTVAGNDDSDGIAPHGTTHRLRRAASELVSQLAVGHRLAVRDGV